MMLQDCSDLFAPENALFEAERKVLIRAACSKSIIPQKNEWKFIRRLLNDGYLRAGQKFQSFELTKEGQALIQKMQDESWIFDKTPTRVRNFDGRLMRGTTTRGRANVLVRYGYAVWRDEDTIQTLYDLRQPERMHKVVRRIIEKREGGKCFWCGKDADTVDHLLPSAAGGLSLVENCVLACYSCNHARGASIPLNIEALWNWLHEKTDHSEICLYDPRLITIQKWLTNRGFGTHFISEVIRAVARDEEKLDRLCALRTSPPSGRERLQECLEGFVHNSPLDAEATTIEVAI